MKTDQQIKKDVIEELGWEPLLNVAGLKVNVQDGIVKLHGCVDSFPKLFVVPKVVQRVKGVKEVVTDLEIALPDEDKLSDNVIHENVCHALKLHNSIPEEKIKIKVDNGMVTLEGDVDWNYQKVAAYKTIRNLKGVVGIADYIRIKAQPRVTDIAENIRKALERRADIEAANIKIETIGNKVILKGTAHSWDERKEAARAAWSSPGVTAVEDEIVIDYY